MKNNILEIAAIINECFYYFKQVENKVRKLKKMDKSYLRLPRGNCEENEIFEKKYIEFRNICKKIHVEVKPIFTQLILNMSHVFKFEIFRNYKGEINIKKFNRFKNGQKDEVNNIRKCVIFFRDAIVHPEHCQKNPSPRANPEFPETEPISFIGICQEEKDFSFQIAQGKIFLFADIKSCLNNMKKMIQNNDGENILKYFKWI